MQKWKSWDVVTWQGNTDGTARPYGGNFRLNVWMLSLAHNLCVYIMNLHLSSESLCPFQHRSSHSKCCTWFSVQPQSPFISNGAAGHWTGNHQVKSVTLKKSSEMKKLDSALRHLIGPYWLNETPDLRRCAISLFVCASFLPVSMYVVCAASTLPGTELHTCTIQTAV